MKKNIVYGILLSIVLSLSGCMEYTSIPESTEGAMLFIKKEDTSSIKIRYNVIVDGALIPTERSTARLSVGKHRFSIRIFPEYDDKYMFYGKEEFFSLNIKINKKYLFHLSADKKLDTKKDKNPYVYFTVEENGKVILSKKMTTIGHKKAEAEGKEIFLSMLFAVL